ncbi:iron chelate uptake ABC transporter family permease subunit [Marinomonas sp. RSW2]|uniref:Iron chelate uptake ABC transporter family permease subunit n=1 Tax=Marinomonas maritima TaxID=2940935 RepID=A0ABT5WFN5_9GAMM|nr:iron chelate uptake ABC transporter family permease subunit [Marinomonas maritima]MDE8603622.1 iron chelate uptake ABC transporter family permease subunit [Marinomonas maritima]
MINLARYCLWVLVCVLAVAFVFMGAGFDFDYIIPNRVIRLVAIVIGGVCIAFSSITFQTITENKILTPAIMGYEAIYLLFQSLLILFIGIESQIVIDKNSNFFLSIGIMLLYSWVIHRWLLSGENNNVYLLLLVGLVLTLLISTFTQFIQFSISPGEFSHLLGYSQASFNRARPEQLAIAAVLVGIVCTIIWKALPTFDVLSLGRHQATSLGIDYQVFIKRHFALIALLVATSTSLLGPTAFMGIFVANTAYMIARSPKHRLTLPTGCAIAIAAFLLAQIMVEHLFNYKTTVGILVNLMCGIYFLVLVIRPRRAS